jgi:hypothetical protein
VQAKSYRMISGSVCVLMLRESLKVLKFST